MGASSKLSLRSKMIRHINLHTDHHLQHFDLIICLLGLQVVKLELRFTGRKSDALRSHLQNEGRLKILREHEKVPLNWSNNIICPNERTLQWLAKCTVMLVCRPPSESVVALMQRQLQEAQNCYEMDSRYSAELLLNLRVEHVSNCGRISKLTNLLTWTEVCLSQRRSKIHKLIDM